MFFFSTFFFTALSTSEHLRYDYGGGPSGLPVLHVEHINGNYGRDLDRVMGRTGNLMAGWARFGKAEPKHVVMIKLDGHISTMK